MRNLLIFVAVLFIVGCSSTEPVTRGDATWHGMEAARTAMKVPAGRY